MIWSSKCTTSHSLVILLFKAILLSIYVQRSSHYDLANYCIDSPNLAHGLISRNSRMSKGYCKQTFEMEISNGTAQRYCRSLLPIPSVTATWTEKKVTCTWERHYKCKGRGFLIESNCYLVTDKMHSFDGAAPACQALGYSIATMSSSSIAEVLVDYLPSSVLDSVWVSNMANDDDSRAMIFYVKDPFNPTQEYIKSGIQDYTIGTSDNLVLFRYPDHSLNIRRPAQLIPAEKKAEFPVLCMVMATSIPGPVNPNAYPNCKGPHCIELGPIAPLLTPEGRLISTNVHVAVPTATPDMADVGLFHKFCQDVSQKKLYSIVTNSSEPSYHAPVQAAEVTLPQIQQINNCKIELYEAWKLARFFQVVLPNRRTSNIRPTAFAQGHEGYNAPIPRCADKKRTITETTKKGLLNVPNFIRHKIFCGSHKEFLESNLPVSCDGTCPGKNVQCNAKGDCECLPGYVSQNPNKFECSKTASECDKCFVGNPPNMECIGGKCQCHSDYDIENNNGQYTCKPKPPPPNPCTQCGANTICTPEKTCKCKEGYLSTTQKEGENCEKTCWPSCRGNGTCKGDVCECEPGYELADENHPTEGAAIRNDTRLKDKICVASPSCACIQNCECVGNRWTPKPQCIAGFLDILDVMPTTASSKKYEPGTYCIKCACSQPEKMECVGDDKCQCKDGYNDAMNSTNPDIRVQVTDFGQKCSVSSCINKTDPYYVSFVYDCSLSIRNDSWNQLMQFFENLHEKLNSDAATVEFVRFGDLGIHIGVLHRGEWNATTWNTLVTSGNFRRHGDKHTSTSRGLATANYHMNYWKMDPSIKKRVILITDGLPNWPGDYKGDPFPKAVTKEVSTEIRQVARMIGLAVGKEADKAYMQEICDEVFEITNYERLEQEFDEVFSSVCEETI